MNNDLIKGKWMELKGEVLNMWGKLTHDELDRTEGNLAAISGLIQEKYGETKEAIGDKLNQLFGNGQEEVSKNVEDAKNFVSDKAEQAKSFVADKSEQAKDALRNANDSASQEISQNDDPTH